MVLRSLIGALVAVAVIGAVAAALPERLPVKQAALPEPQFGQLPKPQFDEKNQAVRPGAGQPPADRQALLRLAAYVPPAAQPVPPKATDPARTNPQPPANIISMANPAAPPTPPGRQVATGPDVAIEPTAQQPLPPPPPTRVASLPTSAPAPKGDGQININKASVAQLDHLPGGGSIGKAIARRRPYHSIDDLVRKRVLKEAAFRRIRPAITVD